MALNKTPVNINFSQGIETKSDPFQVPIGKFQTLKNSVFNKGGLLQKRNGYGSLPSVGTDSSSFLATFNGNLTAIGSSFSAYSASSQTWVDKGVFHPVSLDVLPLIRSNTNQSQADSAVSSTGLVCTVFTDNESNGVSTTPVYKYAIADSLTGQNIKAPTEITAPTGTIEGSPRVFILRDKFIILITNNIAGSYHLKYLAIPVLTPTITPTAVDITGAYTPASTLAFDGVISNNRLYIAWNGNDGGGAIRMTSLSFTLAQSNTVTFPGYAATHMSVTSDETTPTPTIYATFYDSATNDGYTLAVSSSLLTVLAPTQWTSVTVLTNVTSTATNGSVRILSEVDNDYTYDPTIPTHYINVVNVTQAGSVGSTTVYARSVGLASKAFLLNDFAYVMVAYFSDFQPTNFLLDESGDVVAKLAYANAGPYLTTGLPNVSLTDNIAQIPYLIKDLVQATNKAQNASSTEPVYSQTGINLVSFNIGESKKVTAEIGSDLHLTGGFLWMYDGYSPVEHGFHLWPDSVDVTTATGSGNITAQQYYYQATYEWSDNQGNIFRSAPSLPVAITTTTANSTNTINVPTLRLTYKTANPVKIVLYRWSTAQQTYYQVTSIQIPIMNDTTVDYVTITDTSADSAILGNNIIYTTGGVLENISPSGIETMALWQSRLVYLNSEDRNLLGISKQVIQATPVETSDLLTLYVAPTIGSQGSTGPIKTLAALDEKLIVFKENAIYYFNGQGPDNTGANSQIGDPVFVTATVGCSNQASIVFMPSGLMFQSDKGIWLLGRDLSTNYIGSPVEAYTQNATVLSAVSIPGTNQVRFTMDSGITLMYDYFYNQWGTFVNVPAQSSTLYESLHTYLNSSGEVFQETVNQYKDGSNPVVMSFTTGWINPMGLQGFQRAYEMYLLGTYISPHKLEIQIAYDYNGSPSQSTVITPDNFTPAYGGEQLWGSSGPWGGPGNLEQWRIFFQRQKCESFQITINEIYDPSYGQTAGAGLTLSGMNLTVGVKDGKPRLRASRQSG